MAMDQVDAVVTVSLGEVRGVVELSIRNNSRETLRIPKPHFPNSGRLEADIFKVSCAQGRAPYTGPRVRRAKHPGYVQIKPGGVMSIKVNIPVFYDVAGKQACTIQYETVNVVSEEGLVFRLQSNSVPLG